MSVQYGYIPAPLALFSTFAQNFTNLVVASPVTYGMTGPDATSIMVANDLFQNAYALSKKTSPTTRTSTAVSDTSSKKFTLTQLLRSWASQIRLNPGVSDADKVALGLRLPNNAPTPIPTPATWPVLGIQGYRPLGIQLRYHDSSTPTLKAKPYGAIGGELYVGVSTAPLGSASLCTFQGIFTKNYPIISFLSGDAGKIATFFARWVTRGAPHGSEESQVGPFGPGVSAGIAS
jgi:hypothetical protein